MPLLTLYLLFAAMLGADHGKKPLKVLFGKKLLL
jgi:hypothetical protein